MSMTETARELFAAGWTVERVREELRGTVLGEGMMPTCSAVEEAIAEARKIDCPDETEELYEARKKDVLRMVKAIYPWLEKKAEKSDSKGQDTVRITVENLFTMLNICHFIESLDMYEKNRHDLLMGLINLTDNESSDGKWRVSLDYDNEQDVARVLDGDGNVIGECNDIDKEPNEQFITAIAAAIKTKSL